VIIRIENPKQGQIRILVDDMELHMPPVGSALVLKPDKVLFKPRLDKLAEPGDDST